MFEPICFPRRTVLGPTMMVVLLIPPSLVSVWPSTTQLATIPVGPVIKISWPPVIKKTPHPREAVVNRPTQEQNRKDVGRKQQPQTPGLQTNVASVQASTTDTSILRQQFPQLSEDGRLLKRPFTFLVTVNADWLRFLSAYDADLAFSPGLPGPGSPILAYSPRTLSFRDDYLPADVIVRSVEGEVDIPGFETLVQRATRHFGRPAHVFVIYSQDLYWAMQGKAARELRARNLDPERVASVQVRYIPVGSDYDVAVERVVPGN